MFDRVFSGLAPLCCLECGREGVGLCQKCRKKFLPRPAGLVCRGKQRLYAVGPRHGALEQLCDDYKFQSERGLAWVLALWLAAALPVDELRQAGFVLCPVPTAPAHKRERGFDHTKLLAQHLSKITKLPMNSLLWRTNNITQHELPTAAARRQAVKNAFALDKKSLKKPIPPKILLIDDIRTTGATLAACEKALRAAGAKEVRQAVVCYQVDSVKNNKKPPESQ